MTVLLICYIALAVLVGMWANDKGRAGFLGFLAALLLTPLGGAIIVAVLKDKRLREKHDRKPRRISWKLVLAGALATIMVGWFFHTPTPEENARNQAGQFGEYCMAFNQNLRLCQAMCRDQYADATLFGRCEWTVRNYRSGR